MRWKADTKPPVRSSAGTITGVSRSTKSVLVRKPTKEPSRYSMPITESFSLNVNKRINTRVSDVAQTVGQTPQGWNSGIFNMIRNLSENVVVPIAGIILTVVVTLELIQLLTDRNNMHDFDTFIFFKWLIKTFCAVMIECKSLRSCQINKHTTQNAARARAAFGLLRIAVVKHGSPFLH